MLRLQPCRWLTHTGDPLEECELQSDGANKALIPEASLPFPHTEYLISEDYSNTSTPPTHLLSSTDENEREEVDSARCLLLLIKEKIKRADSSHVR